jgi:hypothetical protein
MEYYEECSNSFLQWYQFFQDEDDGDDWEEYQLLLNGQFILDTILPPA